MSIDLNPEEKQILNAAEQGNGFEINKLMHEIPAKEWLDTINHLKQHYNDTHSAPFQNLVFSAIHPWKSEKPGDPPSKIDQNSLQVSIGIYPSPNLFNAVVNLKTGQDERAPSWRNFKW